jgi:hypothetical protein
MRRFVTLALVLAVIGCGSDNSTTPTNTSVAGTWTLQTVNGSALPFTLATSPAKLEVLSYVVVVTSNGTWTSSEQTRTTIGTQPPVTATVTDAGTYTISGNNVALTSNTAGSAAQAGTVSGNTFTIVQSGFTFVFQKQ